MTLFSPNRSSYTVDRWPLQRTLSLELQTFGSDPCVVCGAPFSTCTGKKENHATTQSTSDESEQAYELAKAFILADGGNKAEVVEDGTNGVGRSTVDDFGEPDGRRPNEFFIEF